MIPVIRHIVKISGSKQHQFATWHSTLGRSQIKTRDCTTPKGVETWTIYGTSFDEKDEEAHQKAVFMEEVPVKSKHPEGDEY